MTLGLAAVLIVYLANETRLDLWLADQMFDARLQRFPARHQMVYDTLLHAGIKTVLVMLWLGMAALLCLPQQWRPAWLNTAVRMRLTYVVALAVLNSAVVSWLKHRMPHGCPWDIDRYGGEMPWQAVFTEHLPMAAGHCFPAGHATSALWLCACCLFWLPHQPRKAGMVYLCGLCAGLALGWVQQLRGAHFLSHTLTSAWLMSAWLLLALSLPMPGRLGTSSPARHDCCK